MRGLVLHDRGDEVAGADEDDRRVLDADVHEIWRDDERVRAPRIRAVALRQLHQRPRRKRQDVSRHLRAGIGGDPDGDTARRVRRCGQGHEAADGDGEIADCVRVPAARREGCPGRERAVPARRSHGDVEVGGRRRRALAEDLSRRLRDPAPTGIPRQDREEGAEADAACPAADAIGAAGDVEPPRQADRHRRARADAAAQDERRRCRMRRRDALTVHGRAANVEVRSRARAVRPEAEHDPFRRPVRREGDDDVPFDERQTRMHAQAYRVPRPVGGRRAQGRWRRAREHG